MKREPVVWVVQRKAPGDKRWHYHDVYNTENEAITFVNDRPVPKYYRVRRIVLRGPRTA